MTIAIEKIKQQVNALLHEVFEIPLEKLTASAALYQDLSLDSLDAVDMMVHLEDKLGFKVEAERFRNVRSLGDVYQVVADLMSESSAPASTAGVSGLVEQLLTDAETDTQRQIR